MNVVILAAMAAACVGYIFVLSTLNLSGGQHGLVALLTIGSLFAWLVYEEKRNGRT